MSRPAYTRLLAALGFLSACLWLLIDPEKTLAFRPNREMELVSAAPTGPG